ncbi:DUF2213 domain-containing protein [Neisseria lactamica]|uniref:Large polyvalent protein-associated domain-containing protein n=1 Tax=Neisseria lactamica TaxID=486 RepID=A0AAU8VGW8_NEILA|nr:DUF2213 domain-containing protein [Neisseria lactamica]ARB04776.1 hypothetical protein B2G52_07675 [Neisseria lactamica]CBX21330.1 unnamed protein product [Neisseria lactamica Y92-1009]
MNTQQRAILSKARRLLAMDAEWDESKHPRAENGRFGKGSETNKQTETKSLVKAERKASNFQQAREQAKAFQGKQLVNDSSGLTAVASRNSLDKMLSGKAVGKSSSPALHSLAVANADKLYESAVYGWSKPDRSDDPNITAIHRLFSVLDTDDGRYMAKLTVKETGRTDQNNKFYTIEAVELNEKSPAAQWVDSTVQADWPDPTSIRSVGDILSLAKTVEQNNMITRDNNSIAQDTARSYDKDGRLHVAVSNISKATVNPYYGGEIPNYRQLGLEPKKVYYLLRDPEELEKAAPTFNNLPLLNKHIPVSADEPQKEVIAGTTGSDTVFEDGYLKCSLAVWDAEAIAGIESGEQVELSSAYHYTADMTAGEFEGRHYDGVMRDIVGNHVALVDVGRAGRDVVVSDADPFHERKTMKLKAGAKARIQAAVQPLLAQDAELSPDELLQVIGSLNNEVQTAQDDGGELPPENVENVGTDGDDSDDGENNTAPAEDEAPEAPEGGAPKPAQDAAISKMAMDAAIQKAVAAERKRAQALAAAQREVAHIVGDVAMDNAADVYKFALEQSGIDVTGVHPSAYRAMVGMLGKPKQPMAQDAAKTAEQFPGLSRIRKA